MNGAISEPRDEVADGAPRVEIVHIPQDKIGAVIGPRGAIIKELVEETGAQIDVDEEGGRGVVKIYANSREVAQDALDRINAIANPVLPEKGERYHATVVKTVDFGAFVSLTPGTDGLLHISELSKMGQAPRPRRGGRRGRRAGARRGLDVLDGGRKFKLAYVGEKAGDSAADSAEAKTDAAPRGEDTGDDTPQERPRGRSRGGRDRSGGDAEAGDRGGEARDRGGEAGDRGGEARDRGGEGGGGRTRTRTRSRSRDRD
jgi:polyribonucleotide nucleotidyltransferase